MSSTGIKVEPSWDWSSLEADIRRRGGGSSRVPGSFHEEPLVKQEYQKPSVEDEEPRMKQEYPPQPSVKTEEDEAGPPPSFWESAEYAGRAAETEAEPEEPQPRVWPSRTCRICLEVVPPTVHTSDALPGFLQRKPRVTYVSEDPELGRLIRPCKCKGTSRYVHEGCLQQWRQSDNTFRAKNYWSCPTCGFQYRLSRMTWGRVIKSTGTQIALTVFIFLTTIFVLGFVADPIINFYLDPIDTITSPILDRYDELDTWKLDEDDDLGWIEHFVKGLASLGLLGFIKMFFTLSPWNQWSISRNSGAFSGSGRAGRSGRERLNSVTWIFIITGVLTFLWTVWKGVRAWSRRTLEQASDKVMDVPLDDDEEELVDPTVPPVVPSSQRLTNET